MLFNKKKWSVGLSALLSLVMAVQPVITGYAASSPGAYDTANVKYLYEKDDETGEYYRTGVKSLYIAPNTYYDTTIYKPEDWSTVWKDIGKKSSEDQQRADEVIALIDTLPAIVDITLADKVRVESVRSVYNKLENQQLNLVTNFDTLDKAEKKIEKLKRDLEVTGEDDPKYQQAYAAAVMDKAKAIPAISAGSTLEELREAADQASWARKAYELVSDDQKADLAASDDEAIKKALVDIGADANQLAQATEVKAISYLLTMLPDWYPENTQDAPSEEAVEAALDCSEAILKIYNGLSKELRGVADISRLKDNDSEETYTEETDTGGAISHTTGETYKEINISYLDHMVKEYILEDWAIFADTIFATHGEAANYVSNGDYNKYYRGDKPSRGLNVASALSSLTGGVSSGWGSSNAWRYTGLKAASSLSQVRNAMADEVRSGASRKAVTRGEILDEDELTIGKDRLEVLKSDDKTRALYSIATYVDRSKWDSAITYQSYGLCFYDFDLTIIGDKELNYVTSMEKYNEEDNPIQAAYNDAVPGVKYKKTAGANGANATSYTENNSREEAQVEMGLENSDSKTLTTSFTSEEEYSFSEMIGSSTEIHFMDKFSETINVEFTLGQSYSTARGEENEAVAESSQKVTSGLTLPAQTAAQILQNSETSEIAFNYDTPVAISFKVAVFSIGGHGTATKVSSNFIQDVAGYNTSDFYAVFGGEGGEAGYSAYDNLHRRAVENRGLGGYDTAYGNTVGVFKKVGGRRTELDKIDWNGKFSEEELNSIKYMTERRPMAQSGTVLNLTTKNLTSTINGILPLYLLKTVSLKEDIEDDYDMTVGDTFNLGSLAVDGLNKNKVDYYGFEEDDGHWAFCDENGNVTDHSDYAKITDSSESTGQNILTATAPGTQFIKWVLNNDVVNTKKYTALKEVGYANNDNVELPIVRINITDKPFRGTVILEGDYTGYVDEDPVSLPQNGLKVTMKNLIDQEESRPVTWEAKQLKNIDVTETGDVTFTKPGTYMVRVYVGSGSNLINSNWVEIKALDKKQPASLEISDDNDPKLLAEHVYSGTTESLDLSKLTVKGQDQYGNPWSYQPDDITWNVNGSDLQGADFDVNGAGTYTICAKAGELTSNKLTLAVHELKKVEKKDATCTADGNKAYYECIDCHKLYSDDKATKEMSKADVKVKALGHAWDKGTVKAARATGTGTFTLTCTRDSKHKQVKKINNLLLSAKSSGDRITFKWSKEKLADGYEVYFAKCGGKDQLSSCKLVKTIKNNGTLTYKSGKVVNGKFYKGYVKAFKKISGKKVYLSTSHGVHLIAGNYTKKATNPKAVTVKAKTLSVNVGKTKKITGVKVTKMKGGRKLLTHDKKLRYGSSDSRIATVDGSGKITGVAKGNCTVYVIAINGVRTAVKVSVN